MLYSALHFALLTLYFARLHFAMLYNFLCCALHFAKDALFYSPLCSSHTLLCCLHWDMLCKCALHWDISDMLCKKIQLEFILCLSAIQTWRLVTFQTFDQSYQSIPIQGSRNALQIKLY